ncbi:MAG: 3-dehydroquinate synthase [Bacillota bacterium]|nr:3-dehydroquinate synthase [Bacillota bacterium]
METLQVSLGARSYPILIGSSILSELGSYLVSLNLSPRIFVVTNETVGEIYGERVSDALAKAGFEVLYHELPDGEEYKSLDSASRLYTCALESGLDRQSALVALGGGVIGDLAGFVAATFLRGIPLVQVPTTLLAQVDSSVGGKVAVNHPKGKNMIGCFYQPLLVFTDVATLKTLHLRELRSGLAEVIKYGVIWDEGFFRFLEEHIDQVFAFNQEILSEIIKQSCSIKAKIVEKDERESGLRAILNFGHTIGHALETLAGYRVYRHGEAVSMGMVAAATLAVRKGLMDSEDRDRLVALLERAGLPTRLPCAAGEIQAVLPRDKKVLHGKLRFVLPLALGHVEIFSELEPDEIRVALEECREKGRDDYEPTG